jgi:integrase
MHSSTIVARYRDLHDPAGFAALDRLCQATSGLTAGDRQIAFHQLTRILIHNGGRLADITVPDCVEAYRAQTGYTSRQHSHWYVLLRDAAVLPVGAPPTIWAAARRGQLTVEELVDGYQVSCVPVRDLLVDYLHERQPGMDYTSLRQLSSKLVLLFWRDLELHEPGIDSLHLADPVARAWKQRLSEVRHGTHRIGQRRQDLHAILLAVRAFYADLTHWALEDPARWGPWAAHSPVSSRDLAGLGKQRTRARSRMHQRTRELAPMLPALVTAAEDQRRRAGAVLEAARAVQPGQEFEVAGQRLRRTALVTDPERGGKGRPGVVYAVDADGSGSRRNLTLADDDAFWTWAIVETLRHTGVRIEEMLELTHRSFAAYTLPTTGEVIPLLHVTPSKTDRERLLVVSPELAEVLTAIIARVRGGGEQLPLVSRYDHAERLHSAPLPFLFQRRWGLRQQALTHLRVKDLLDRLVIVGAITAADGSPLRFTPHDFRRIFATDAVASGLPVHIAAKLLGHQTLATTQAYVAVYDRDVIDHHRAFLARRRTLRPSEEYREPTDAEWDEFLGHFEKRKVELGVCGRAYGTACQHEHACLSEMTTKAVTAPCGRMCSQKVTEQNLRSMSVRACRARGGDASVQS